MKVTYTELIEDDESYYDPDDEHAVCGHIDANDQIIVRYFAYWVSEFPAKCVTFDIIFFCIDKFQRCVPSEAISVTDHGLGSLYFNDATLRPFAHGQAKHCKFPQPAQTVCDDSDNLDEISSPSDISSIAVNTLSYIYTHDSRLRGCFGKSA